MHALLLFLLKQAPVLESPTQMLKRDSNTGVSL